MDSSSLTTKFGESWMRVTQMRARNNTLRMIISQSDTFRSIKNIYMTAYNKYRDSIMWYYNLSESEQQLIDQTIALTY